jgi:hypothetical protein
MYLGSAGYCASLVFTISDSTVKGVWIANTLPVPGNNVFVDQDMPPYVGELAQSGAAYLYEGIDRQMIVAVAGNDLVGITEPLASTMRQAAYVVGGYYNYYFAPVPGNKNWGVSQPGITPRPTKYLVVRNTDFVPFNYGFNPNDTESIYSNQIATMDGSPNYYGIYFSGTYAAVKIRLVASGTGNVGWKGGVFTYGQELPYGLQIFVAKGENNYVADFSKTDNEVTIPTDGGGGYLASAITAGGLNFWVVNTNPTADMSYDLVIELDFADNPQRQYFAPSGTGDAECFSYCLDGTPAQSLNFQYNPKPVPQNGYCIFKVRATRLPIMNSAGISVTPSSGDEIVVTLGQNKLQESGNTVFTPFYTENGLDIFTVTIPADARDSGDIDVFWPVLGGNELVWQCGQGSIANASVSQLGTGYIKGQVLTIVGGVLKSGATVATITIDTVGSQGQILTSHISNSSSYTSAPQSPNAVTGGSGSSATFNLTMSIPAIVEAWVNWQPIWFASVYGLGKDLYGSGNYSGTFDATAFQYCLSFTNFYNQGYSGYPTIWYYDTATIVQFPLDKAIYNDLETCLNLIA